MILVVGSTGRIGRALLGRLSGAGVPVRSMVRSPAKASRIDHERIDVVHGDLADPTSLSKAVTGVEAVFLLSSPHPRQVELQGNAIRAALAAGVRRIVKLSAAGAGPGAPAGLIRWHSETERDIEDSGLAFTHLRPTGFMQNTLASAASVAAEGVIRGTQGGGRVAWIDARDVAAVAAEVLLGSGHDGKAYEITGPALLSQSDLADRIAVAIGRPVEYVDVPEPEMRQRLIDAGMPAWLADEVLALAAWWRADGDAHVTDGVAGLTGAEPRTFEAFAREFAHRFVGREAGTSDH